MAEKITMGPDGTLHVPDEPDHPLHRGRRHRGRHLARRQARPRRRRRQARQDHRMEGGARRREGVQRDRGVAARRDGRGVPRPPHRHQGTAHDPDRRRHPVAQRRAAPDCSTSTSACARSAGSRACPRRCKHPEKVDMVIFRENTEDVYAGLELQEGTDEGGSRLSEFLQDSYGWDIREIPASASSRSRRPARSGSSARRSSTRVERHRRVGHTRAQGEHPEVHRGRVSGSGATSSSGRSSPTSPSAGTTAAVSPATRSS